MDKEIIILDHHWLEDHVYSCIIKP
ncbi:hypothetical protein NC652_028500 [Populus alba x Populus x berolinensis]|uniref:Uncharacterized protein n=1 Tax=Populus alba x Populus x berolinensis TaxID=444605 RepID=A0AAD6QUK8_9ROSI|nr:hypothetical protein NC651_038388 [Populus alba x Populus x berolinensis]KAJ6894762.1 hypothetical protein NC652_028500 [Populus alba x Populus x berolinensis]KAJ6996852.1 hypothetical protein NC653_013438 [Populus alba x Populus x berolinensis]KAJ7015274.1 hypothetical protein NC653_004549 [Populus alba x Populus x berolinensis]KAJ7015278.1 hypothetical protein NC653_004553 [Populus alba x Populus x berolinensis]